MLFLLSNAAHQLQRGSLIQYLDFWFEMLKTFCLYYRVERCVWMTSGAGSLPTVIIASLAGKGYWLFTFQIYQIAPGK
jgi:hypothetical protein